MKGQLCVNANYAQDLGFVWGPFQRGLGGVGAEVERGNFQRFAQVQQPFLRLMQAHRLLSPSIPDLYDWRKAPEEYSGHNGR
jgi:hypothetical protein